MTTKSETISCLIGFIAIGLFLLVLITYLPAFAQTNNTIYSNYTSDKYQIQFQYPTDWEPHEKSNRFEEGTDIEVKHISLENPGFVQISYIGDLTKEFGTNANDLQSATLTAFKGIVGSDYSKEYKVIEPISFTNISGYKAGTFLYTIKDKYGENPNVYAQQVWLPVIGNKAYLITFMSTTTNFDNPEITEIRNHFLKSIKFLGLNSTQSNQPSRFD